MLMKQDNLEKMRHSAEHVLTQVMLRLYPGLKMAMGPATDEGFYFDFDCEKKITESDFPRIEKEMGKIVKKDLPIKKEIVSIKEARKLFEGNEYKQEWLDEIEKKGEQAVVYRTGEEFVDLCSGPHVASTGKIGPFKLLSIAGAYWRGDEKNKMLTRIYGTCFSIQEELDKYLELREEAKRRDHRKLGRELELFTLSEQVGPGLALWLPKGNIIKEELEKWAKEIEKNWGYSRVTTPHITKAGLYYTSGHLPYYKDDMYPPMKLDDGEEYFLKPMNCPHHHMIYNSKSRSYKDLPLRLAEYGTCYRYESSGELFGLMRVRGFAQNDAHIYCTLEQAVQEFLDVMKLHEHFYQILGIEEYHLELSLRDPENKEKYHGDEKMWQLAEKLMRQAVAKTKIRMVEQKGSAAFYGPKIDFIIHSTIGREFAISTNQIDLFMGERFNLKYIDNKGKEKTPVIIHRAPLGAHERFIGFLIEHYAGAFPVWLHPVQVKILPVSIKQNKYAEKVMAEFKKALPDLRIELDNSDETLGNRIRKAQEEKVPYMLIIGAKEEQNKSLSLRLRTKEEIGEIKIEQFIDKAGKIIVERLLKVW